jgi:hypothetical protein
VKKYIYLPSVWTDTILKHFKEIREKEFAKEKVVKGFLQEPEFVDLCRSPEIDSRPGGTVPQPYLTYRAANLNRLEGINSLESIPGLL